MSKSKIKMNTLTLKPDALEKDQELFDCISLVTAIFASAKRRPAVRGAFFAILKSTATLLLAEDKKFPSALKAMDEDAIHEGYGGQSPVRKLVKPRKRKKAVARRR